MSTTYTEIKLSSAYRHVLRTVSASLEGQRGNARRATFAARAALTSLDATDYHRLVRWLAWQCVAADSRGNSSLPSRIQRMDAELAAHVERCLPRLPTMLEERGNSAPLRRSA